LPPTQTPLNVGTADFDRIVAESKVPVLVDFWAPWCGPCKMAAPYVEQVARNLAGQALVLKVDTDQHPDLASRFQIRGIPTFAVLRHGQVVRRESGLLGAQQLQQLVTG
jgi:thioredoxin 2